LDIASEDDSKCVGHYPLGWAGSVHSAGCYRIHGGDGKIDYNLAGDIYLAAGWWRTYLYGGGINNGGEVYNRGGSCKGG
jgi:hypothetical protein